MSLSLSCIFRDETRFIRRLVARFALLSSPFIKAFLIGVATGFVRKLSLPGTHRFGSQDTVVITAIVTQDEPTHDERPELLQLGERHACECRQGRFIRRQAGGGQLLPCASPEPHGRTKSFRA